MQYSTFLATALAGFTFAAPSALKARDPQTLTISEGFARSDNGVLNALGFKLSTSLPEGAIQVGCSAPQDVAVPSVTYGCDAVPGDNNDYSFAITAFSLSGVEVIISAATGVAAGVQGQITIPLVSRAGGNGPQDYVSEQPADIAIVLY